MGDMTPMTLQPSDMPHLVWPNAHVEQSFMLVLTCVAVLVGLAAIEIGYLVETGKWRDRR
jgi:hypothetical protein